MAARGIWDARDIGAAPMDIAQTQDEPVEIDAEDVAFNVYECWDSYAKGIVERSVLYNARGLKGRIGCFALNGRNATLKVKYTVYPPQLVIPAGDGAKKRKRDAAKLVVDLDNDDDDNENEELSAAIAAQASGRLIARGPSVQHVKRVIRHFCFYTTTHDVDQVNSCATIIAFIANNCGMNVPVLEDYIANRADWLQRISDALGVEYSVAKDNVIAVLYGRPSNATEYLKNLSDEIEAVRAVAINEPTLRAPFQDAGLSEKQIFARIVFRLERRITVQMAVEFAKLGYSCSGFLHDGILIQRKYRLPDFYSDDNPLPLSEIGTVEARIKEKFGIDMKLREKSQKPTDDEIVDLIESPRVVRNEGEAAIEIMIHCSNAIANTDHGLAVYSERDNTWSFDPDRNIRELQQLCARFSDRLTSPRPGRRRNFLLEGRLLDNVYAKLQSVVPVDHDWIREADQRTRLKLCYRNGYYDFAKSYWYPGKCPEMRFVVGVQDNLGEKDPEAMREVNEFLCRPFKDEAVALYYLKGMARAVAGDVAAKVAYIILSDTNGGKSTTTRAFKSAFEGVVAPFDASNLANKPRADDRSKTNKWIGPIARMHVAISNEIEQEGKINFNSTKSFISGGRDHVIYRLLNKNEVSTPIYFTMIIFVNMFPDFTHVDDAVVERLRVLNMDRTAFGKADSQATEDTDDHFVPMKGADEFIESTRFRNGLRWLMKEAYMAFLEHGNPEPPAVLAATRERVVTTDVLETVGKYYECWSEAESKSFLNNGQAADAGWFVSCADFGKRIKEHHPVLSIADIIRQVRRSLPLVRDADLRRNLAPRVKGLVGLRPLLGGDGRGLRD